MDHFNYREAQLFAEDIPLETIAKRYDTPCYVYSRATLERHWHAFDQAFAARPHMICYAVKANANIAVLNALARLGSGFDIVSGGELERVLAAGGQADRIVFSGVGKQPEEMARALHVGIHCFNVESQAELAMLNSVAKAQGVQAPVSLRVNPDVDAQTHPYISTGLSENKFGIDIRDCDDVYRYAHSLEHLKVIGIDCHIGSQLTSLAPFLDALDRVLDKIDALAQQGIVLQHLDIGGGLGVRYQDESPPSPAEYVTALNQRLGQRSLKIIMEPGRAIAANAGILLTRVILLKETRERHFAVVDAAMNDLLRPALYQAWQAIEAVSPRDASTPEQHYDIVGPICETGDFLGKDRLLRLQAGDLLAIRSAGAYGFTMASKYNSRNRAAEIMVDGEHDYLIRQRESFAQQMALESCLP